MSVLAATTVAALLIASPSSSDADRLAANGGFLLGSAQRCGIEGERIVQAGQLIRNLILAAATDRHEREEATARFAKFFLVSAAADSEPAVASWKSSTVSAPSAGQMSASCRKVAVEFERFEGHRLFGEASGMRFRLGDGG